MVDIEVTFAVHLMKQIIRNYNWTGQDGVPCYIILLSLSLNDCCSAASASHGVEHKTSSIPFYLLEFSCCPHWSGASSNSALQQSILVPTTPVQQQLDTRLMVWEPRRQNISISKSGNSDFRHLRFYREYSHFGGKKNYRKSHFSQIVAIELFPRPNFVQPILYYLEDVWILSNSIFL